MNLNSQTTYYSLNNAFGKQRELIFNYIKNNPGSTRKQILKALKIELSNGGRITEMFQANYFTTKYDAELNSDRIFIKVEKYNDEDFTSDKLKARALARKGLTNKSEFLAKIGEIVVELFADSDKTNEDRLRFLNFLDKAINQFKKDSDKNKLDETIKLAKKVWGGTYE